jgi:CubicO group peptidase (beta-lactamase class C family)
MPQFTCNRSLCAFVVLILSAMPPLISQAAQSLPTGQPESVGMSSERLARIAPAMQRYIDAKLVPGTVTAIMRRGKLVHLEVQGDMDVANGSAMQRDTMFRIASMTKPIASAALMMLWEEGHFQLRDPVAKFLPEFADPMVSSTADVSAVTGTLVPAERPIQIRDMLTHTADLARWTRHGLRTWLRGGRRSRRGCDPTVRRVCLLGWRLLHHQLVGSGAGTGGGVDDPGEALWPHQHPSGFPGAYLSGHC